MIASSRSMCIFGDFFYKSTQQPWLLPFDVACEESACTPSIPDLPLDTDGLGFLLFIFLSLLTGARLLI